MTNALYLTDKQGVPVIMSSPQSEEYHDIYNIGNAMLDGLTKSHIRTDGLFLNADVGFDCCTLRAVLENNGIIDNICINKRNGTTNSVIIDDLLYHEQCSIERTNAWLDSYRTIVNRFDTTVRNWEAWNYIAFAVIL